MNSLYSQLLSHYKKVTAENNFIKTHGQVTKVIGLVIEAQGIKPSVGEICHIYLSKGQEFIKAEVVGFNGDAVLLMPLGELSGISPGDQVIPLGKKFSVKVGPELLGQILDGLGQPIEEGKFLLPKQEYCIDKQPPNPLQRKPIRSTLETGVKAIDGFLTCGQGQRLGVFAGSGVGKSTLLGMLARNSSADVNVIGLIGERGREVLEFIKNDLGDEGLMRSIVVVATSDQPALIRLKAAFVATAIAEYFRDQGQNVMLMMDSVTRFAMAQREVGLTIGEPPASKGYTPSVFALLPKLLERSGTSDKGTITGLYTVLVDGDDFNEPIADAVRGILDGHIVLSRKLAAENHFPAIDIMNSISRLMPQLAEQEHLRLAGELKELMAAYEKAEDLINIGAYKMGTNAKIDQAVNSRDEITRFLRQGIDETFSFEQSINALKQLSNR